MNLSTNSCPCCGNSLLRHVRHGKVCWFCTSCWLEVPLFAISQATPTQTAVKRQQPVKV